MIAAFIHEFIFEWTWLMFADKNIVRQTLGIVWKWKGLKFHYIPNVNVRKLRELLQVYSREHID